MGAESGQHKHDERFRRLIENLQEEYFVYAREPSGRFSYVGPSITRVLGYLPEEFCERFTQYLTNSPANEEALRRARQEGDEARQAAYEVEILHRDGSLRWLEVTEAPVAVESGEPDSFEGIARNVTARKEAEESRRQVEEQARQAQKIKSLGVMAGGIAHDFNNLLQAIPGNADLLCRLTPSGTRERKFSVEIRKAAGRAAAPRDCGKKGTILLVDDEECVIVVAQNILEREGYPTLSAPDGPSAIEIVRNRGGEIACVLLDLGMPGMSGEETLVELRRIRADLPVIISSGYSEQEVANRFAGQKTAGFISKPYLPLSLVSLIREVLG